MDGSDSVGAIVLGHPDLKQAMRFIALGAARAGSFPAERAAVGAERTVLDKLRFIDRDVLVRERMHV
ncbi:hypothetical protein [Pararobbsia silviterrae]|uniref:hypothetical protein n=1 Tax=Pararobbsia silviterrae TaxID=1792498 RepID=UPI0030B83711